MEINTSKGKKINLLKIKLFYFNFFDINVNLFNLLIIFGDWGLGIGDWGLGIGPNPHSPIPNPQSPIPI